MPRRPSSRRFPQARLAALLLFLAATATVALLVASPPEKTTPPERTVPAAGTASPERTAPPVSGRRIDVPPEHPRPEREGMVAMIIDDAGYNLDELQAFLDLPVPLTVAVLPNLPHSREAARRVLAAGKDLILHCPIEPMGNEDPGPGALRVGESAETTEALLAAAFASVPGARGMNNHMGSRGTADPDLMRAVLGYLRKENLFYVDSRTTADTVGPRIAQELGVPFAERDLFIDDDPSVGPIGIAFDRGAAEAKARGTAVMIGHVQNRGVVDILRARDRALTDLGFRWARLDDVMRDRERKPAP